MSQNFIDKNRFFAKRNSAPQKFFHKKICQQNIFDQNIFLTENKIVEKNLPRKILPKKFIAKRNLDEHFFFLQILFSLPNKELSWVEIQEKNFAQKKFLFKI